MCLTNLWRHTTLQLCFTCVNSSFSTFSLLIWWQEASYLACKKFDHNNSQKLAFGDRLNLERCKTNVLVKQNLNVYVHVSYVPYVNVAFDALMWMLVGHHGWCLACKRYCSSSAQIFSQGDFCRHSGEFSIIGSALMADRRSELLPQPPGIHCQMVCRIRHWVSTLSGNSWRQHLPVHSAHLEVLLWMHSTNSDWRWHSSKCFDAFGWAVGRVSGTPSLLSALWVSSVSPSSLTLSIPTFYSTAPPMPLKQKPRV